MSKSDDVPAGALLPGRVGLFVRLVCQPGARTAALDVINRYMDRLGEEPGTEAYIVAVDPESGDAIWLYEWFRDTEALEAHRNSEPFAEMITELTPVVETPASMMRIDPLRVHLHRAVVEGRTLDQMFE